MFATYPFAIYTRLLASVFATCIFQYPDFFQANIRKALKVRFYFIFDSGYPHYGRADKNPYPHDRRADKDSYPHDSNNLCIILWLQLSFVMINVQLMLG